VNRLFTIGCSFTAYHYPTWADIAGTAFDYFENWGKPNSGNNYILNSLIELDLRHKLTSEDTVYIMWSGIARQDYYVINEWLSEHNTFKQVGFSDIRGYEILNYAWFASAQHILDRLGVTWRMFGWQHWDAESNIQELYAPVLAKIDSIDFKKTRTYPYSEPIDSKLLYQRLSGPDWPSHDDIIKSRYTANKVIQTEIDKFLVARENLKQTEYTEPETHPSPASYLQFVESKLSNLTLSRETREYITSIDECLYENKPYEFRGSRPLVRL